MTPLHAIKDRLSFDAGRLRAGGFPRAAALSEAIPTRIVTAGEKAAGGPYGAGLIVMCDDGAEDPGPKGFGRAATLIGRASLIGLETVEAFDEALVGGLAMRSLMVGKPALLCVTTPARAAAWAAFLRLHAKAPIIDLTEPERAA